MLGLSDKAEQPQALLIAPCHHIHTFGMRFAIDVAYLAANGRVLRVSRGLVPGKLPRGCPSAVAVLERRASEDDWLQPGQRIELAVSREERILK